MRNPCDWSRCSYRQSDINPSSQEGLYSRELIIIQSRHSGDRTISMRKASRNNVRSWILIRGRSLYLSGGARRESFHEAALSDASGRSYEGQGSLSISSAQVSALTGLVRSPAAPRLAAARALRTITSEATFHPHCNVCAVHYVNDRRSLVN